MLLLLSKLLLLLLLLKMMVVVVGECGATGGPLVAGQSPLLSLNLNLLAVGVREIVHHVARLDRRPLEGPTRGEITPTSV